MLSKAAALSILKKINRELHIRLNSYSKYRVNAWLTHFWYLAISEIQNDKNLVFIQRTGMSGPERVEEVEKLVETRLFLTTDDFVSNLSKALFELDRDFHWRIESCADQIIQLSNHQQIILTKEKSGGSRDKSRGSSRYSGQEYWISSDLPDIDPDASDCRIYYFRMENLLCRKVNRELESELKYLRNFLVSALLTSFWDSIYLKILKESNQIITKTKREGGDISDLSVAIANEAENRIYIEMENFLQIQREFVLQLDDDYLRKLEECVTKISELLHPKK